MFKQRILVRFSKQGDLRFISHQDLMRLFERALRRTGLPLRMSQGFNPRPCISFPQALGVGMKAEGEVMEFELDRWVPVGQAGALLEKELPAGVRLKEVQPGHPHHKAQVEQISYRVVLPPGTAIVSATVAGLLDSKHLMVNRQRKGKQKQVDIRPYILELSLEGKVLHMKFAVTDTGTTRPEEVLQHLGVDPLKLDMPLQITRSRVKLEPLPETRDRPFQQKRRRL